MLWRRLGILHEHHRGPIIIDNNKWNITNPGNLGGLPGFFMGTGFDNVP